MNKSNYASFYFRVTSVFSADRRCRHYKPVHLSVIGSQKVMHYSEMSLQYCYTHSHFPNLLELSSLNWSGAQEGLISFESSLSQIFPCALIKASHILAVLFLHLIPQSLFLRMPPLVSIWSLVILHHFKSPIQPLKGALTSSHPLRKCQQKQD